MAKRTTGPTDEAKDTAQAHDPYAIRTVEQLLSLPDNGDFLARILDESRNLRLDLVNFYERYGSKGCEGGITIKLKFAVGGTGDTGIAATLDISPPKPPAAKAAAYTDEDGNLTLHSPMMAKMHRPVREVVDRESGEVRDI